MRKRVPLLVGIFIFASSLASASPAQAATAPAIATLHVNLPKTVRPFPEPLAAGAPQFKIRGTKGWDWTPQQYLEEIPYLKKAKMNFLMDCYLSMLDDKTHRNLWWQPLPPEKKRAYEKVVSACRQTGITFCFAMHPQIRSDRPLNLSSDKDFHDFYQHFAWMQSLGVRWFSVSMDDVGGAKEAVEQSNFCNRMLHKLREKDPQANLIFCPTVYATSMIAHHKSYLPTLAQNLDKDVYIFWTGPNVVSLTISRKDAEHYRNLVGHRLIIWDNYPVNDARPTQHLGPITGRDPELCKVVDGYMANPMYLQHQIGRIPLYTMADYAFNPEGYSPERSIGQAIIHLADTEAKQRTLADLVEAYPGDLFYRKPETGFNSVQYQYAHLATGPSAQARGETYIRRLQKLLSDLRTQFPGEYIPADHQLQADIDKIQQIQNHSFPEDLQSNLKQ